MNKVLVYSGLFTTDPVAWDVSTEELRNKAFLELFRILDSKDYFSVNDVSEMQLRSMAQRGNAKFAQALLIIKQVPFWEIPVRGTPDTRPVVAVPCPEAVSDSNLPDLSRIP